MRVKEDHGRIIIRKIEAMDIIGATTFWLYVNGSFKEKIIAWDGGEVYGINEDPHWAISTMTRKRCKSRNTDDVVKFINDVFGQGRHKFYAY